MGPSTRNKLNDLSPKEWTKYSTSVISHESKKNLISFLSRIYSKVGDSILSVGEFDSVSLDSQKKLIDLVIVDLSSINSLSIFQKGIKWYSSFLTSLSQFIHPKKYLLVIVQNFTRMEEKVGYFPTHIFVQQISRDKGYQQTDFWIDETLNVFILSYKLNKKDKTPARVKLYPEELCSFHGTKDILVSENNRVLEGFSSIREPEYVKHGATFPQELIEFLLTRFTKENDTILDIFAGVGVTLLAARSLKRNCIGIELNPKYIKWNQDVLERLETPISQQDLLYNLINDDARNLAQWVETGTIDLMITSPPYFNLLHKISKEARKRGRESVFRRRGKTRIQMEKDTLEKEFTFIPHPYSGDAKDLGNINSYENFLNQISLMHQNVMKTLKPGGVAIWIIRDFRNMRVKEPYVPFHSDLTILAIKEGYILSDILIWKQNRERRLIHLGGGFSYYNSMTHSFIVVLQKPLDRKNKDIE